MKAILELLRKHFKGIAVTILLGGGAAMTLAVSDTGEVSIDFKEPVTTAE